MVARIVSAMTNGERVEDLIGKGMTVLEISRLLSISPQAVYKHIHRLGLPLPTKAP